MARSYFDRVSNSVTDPAPIPPCPRCSGAHVVRNGVNASGTPVFRCQARGRRLVAAPKKGPVGEPGRDLVRRRLAERVGIRATARSRSWVPGFVNALYREGTPHDPGPPPKSPARS